MRLPKQPISLAIASVLGLTLAACGQTSATRDGNGTAAATTDASPMSEIIGAVWGLGLSPEEEQRRLDQEQQQREEYIAQCMNALGFDYFLNPGPSAAAVIRDESLWRPDDRDWVELWGYGAVHSPLESGAPNALRPPPSAEVWVDSNQEMLDAMSETERAAWQTALWELPWDELPASLFDESGQINNDFSDGPGCLGWGMAQVDASRPFTIHTAGEFRPLLEAITAMNVSVVQSPEWQATDRDWANCMANAGYPGFTQQWDAQMTIFRERNTLENAPEMDNWDWSLGSPNPANHPAWAALAQREVEIALADLDCRVSTDLPGRRQHIQFTIESQFINDHRAALDALVAVAAEREQ